MKERIKLKCLWNPHFFEKYICAQTAQFYGIASKADILFLENCDNNDYLNNYLPLNDDFQESKKNAYYNNNMYLEESEKIHREDFNNFHVETCKENKFLGKSDKLNFCFCDSDSSDDLDDILSDAETPLATSYNNENIYLL